MCHEFLESLKGSPRFRPVLSVAVLWWLQLVVTTTQAMTDISLSIVILSVALFVLVFVICRVSLESSRRIFLIVSRPRLMDVSLMDHSLATHGQNRVWYISAGNELKFWLLL